MEKSKLVPFIRKDLDILFVGLNPADGSNKDGHYFSVNSAFWNQLHQSGLITVPINKIFADDIIFGSNDFNYKKWEFGITDLVIELAESNSKKIKPSSQECKILKQTVLEFQPKTLILLHKKVLRSFLRYLGIEVPKSNTGKLGKLIPGVESVFFNIAFPHGNKIPKEDKVKRYIELKTYLEGEKVNG